MTPTPFTLRSNLIARLRDIGIAVLALTWACVLLLAPGTAGADTTPHTATETAQSDEDRQVEPTYANAPWVRVVQDDARVVQLQIAVRRFERTEGDGPSLTVAGAVHVGDRSYYRTLQEMLEQKDLVLFEGVRPAGAEDTEPRTPAEQVQRSEDRVRLLGTFLAQAALVAERRGLDAPQTVEALERFLTDHELHRAHTWLAYATHDGWGNPLIVQALDDGEFDVVSLGADNEPGGTGRAADLRLSDQRPLTGIETGQEPGMQARLAEVLRLTFQLDEMDESGEKWRNADMSVAEVRSRIAALGGDPDVLFSQLEGGGFTGAIINLLLGFIDVMPGMAPRVKLMMIDMLENAEQILAAGAGPIGEEILTVIIEERNQVIMDKLVPVVEEEAAELGLGEVGIIYGAGHMPDLVDRLREQLAYEPVQEEWVTAISLDLNRYGISPLERRMVKRQIQQQLRQMELQNRR